tara:strand:- start:115 stop:633 length:519 start_codon:yes stop_codon:yes gene_type:complete
MIVVFCLAGCKDLGEENMVPIKYLDIKEFMGVWYVIASIPTFLERGAINPTEKYSLNPDGTVSTEFSYLRQADGHERNFKSKAFIKKGTGNAVWGMQFLWPIKADYRIVYLSPDKRVVVIARQKRDYLWIMSREKEINEDELAVLVNFSKDLGYDVSKIELSSWQRKLKEVI